MGKVPTALAPLFQAASEARDKAYAPYSGHHVGAAIRTEGGKIFAGCNVENSSYGATNCAERVAIQSAVAAHGKFKIVEVMVVTNANPPWPPCGLCRQVIAEFAVPGTKVYSSNVEGKIREQKFSDLFPEAFTPGHLAK